MAVTQSGISTIGVKLGYALGTSASAPASFTWLERVNSIGGVEVSRESIDASALEDQLTRYIAGRMDPGSDWSVDFNVTNEVITQIEAMMTAYSGKTSSQVMWFEIWSPYLTKAFAVIAAPPTTLPMPEVGQNELQTITLNFVLEEYKGMITAVEPSGTTGTT